MASAKSRYSPISKRPCLVSLMCCCHPQSTLVPPNLPRRHLVTVQPKSQSKLITQVASITMPAAALCSHRPGCPAAPSLHCRTDSPKDTSRDCVAHLLEPPRHNKSNPALAIWVKRTSLEWGYLFITCPDPGLIAPLGTTRYRPGGTYRCWTTHPHHDSRLWPQRPKQHSTAEIYGH